MWAYFIPHLYKKKKKGNFELRRLVQQNKTRDINRENDLLEQVLCASLAIKTEFYNKTDPGLKSLS